MYEDNEDNTNAKNNSAYIGTAQPPSKIYWNIYIYIYMIEPSEIPDVYGPNEEHMTGRHQVECVTSALTTPMVDFTTETNVLACCFLVYYSHCCEVLLKMVPAVM